MLWAYTPAAVLEAHGVHYYPSQYWAVALPVWACAAVVFVFWLYEGCVVWHCIEQQRGLADKKKTASACHFSDMLQVRCPYPWPLPPSPPHSPCLTCPAPAACA